MKPHQLVLWQCGVPAISPSHMGSIPLQYRHAYRNRITYEMCVTGVGRPRRPVACARCATTEDLLLKLMQFSLTAGGGGIVKRKGPVVVRM